MSCDTALTRFCMMFAALGGSSVEALGGPDLASTVLNRIAGQARSQPWLHQLPLHPQVTSTMLALRAYQELQAEGRYRQAQALLGMLKLFQRMTQMGIDPCPHPPSVIPRRPAIWFGYAAIEDTLTCLDLGGGFTELPLPIQAIVTQVKHAQIRASGTSRSALRTQQPADLTAQVQRLRHDLAVAIMAAPDRVLTHHITRIESVQDATDVQYLWGCAVIRYAQLGNTRAAQELVQTRLGYAALRAELQARLPDMDATILPAAYALCRMVPGEDAYQLLKAINDRHLHLATYIEPPHHLVDASSFSAWLNTQALLARGGTSREWKVTPRETHDSMPTQLAIWCEHIHRASHMDGIAGYLFRGRLGLRGAYQLSLVPGGNTDQGRVFIFGFDLLKSPSDEPVAHLNELADVLATGSPVRTTNRAGPGTRGTRAHQAVRGRFLLAWR